MEIERKYTIKKLPVNLDSYESHHIEQAYLNTDPVIRIRKEDEEYYLTYKGKGLLAREEYNLPSMQPPITIFAKRRTAISSPKPDI